jgi:hypothetical protein
MTADPASAAPARARTEEELLSAGDRVAQLLEEVRSMAGPSAWQRVEELVQRLLELYGAGLERVIAHAVAVEGARGALAERLQRDALVSSLLALHGLHPSPTTHRVERALADVRERLGLLALELVALEPEGALRLRAAADPRSCPSSGATLARAIERTVIEAAPELASVIVEGLEPAPKRPGHDLVQLGLPHGGGARR